MFCWHLSSFALLKWRRRVSVNVVNAVVGVELEPNSGIDMKLTKRCWASTNSLPAYPNLHDCYKDNKDAPPSVILRYKCGHEDDKLGTRFYKPEQRREW